MQNIPSVDEKFNTCWDKILEKAVFQHDDESLQSLQMSSLEFPDAGPFMQYFKTKMFNGGYDISAIGRIIEAKVIKKVDFNGYEFYSGFINPDARFEFVFSKGIAVLIFKAIMSYEPAGKPRFSVVINLRPKKDIANDTANECSCCVS